MPEPESVQDEARPTGAEDRGASEPQPAKPEDKKKVWTRRIVGLIVLFAILGSVMLLIAASAVANLFNWILAPLS